MDGDRHKIKGERELFFSYFLFFLFINRPKVCGEGCLHGCQTDIASNEELIALMRRETIWTKKNNEKMLEV